MNIEEAMMPIDEWNKQFSCKRMQQPISFLTEEDLNKLEQHCEKTIKYGNGRILEEHQITLELIIRYRELKQELEKEKEKNKELSNSYDKLAKECNEENRRCMLLAVENQDLKEKNKELNILRLELLISQFPDTTETYKKYKKELDELLKEE